MAVFINEFHYDNTGSDVGEFIEVAGEAGTDLAGWSIVLYNGSGGRSYGTIQLAGMIPDEGNGFGTVSFARASIQNGSPDGFALVDPGGEVREFLSYEGTFTAADGAAVGLTSTDVGVAEGGGTPVGSSLALQGTGSAAADFTWSVDADDTPGATNNGQTFVPGSGGAPFTVEATDATRAEGDAGVTTLTFTVVRTDDLSGSLELNYVVTGSGNDPAGADDFAGGAFPRGFVGMEPGQASAVITVEVAGDEELEADEAFTITVTEAPPLGPGASVSAVGTILNDDVGPPTLISDIQGTGAESPLVGETVTVEAVVVGDFQDGDADRRDLNGFYVQEQSTDEDGLATTSEGLFVFDGSDAAVDVNVGDVVRVTGVVGEAFGQTQLGDISDVTVVSTGNDAEALVTRADIDLSDATAVELEAAEGMLVRFDGELVITEQFNLDRFVEVRLFDDDDYAAGDRPLQFTQINAPDAAAFDSYNAAIDADSIVYDDGRTGQNLPIGDLDGFGPVYDTAGAPRMGDAIVGLTGVLGFGFGEYRVHSTVDGENEVVNLNPRPAAPQDVGGDLTVATLNVLNFFTTLDQPGENGAGPNGLDPRGADSALELERQLEKLVEAVVLLDADVLGLVELENDFLAGGLNPAAEPGQEDVAIQALVDAINAELGVDRYDWVRPGQEFVGGDAIAVGYIYDTATVGLAGRTVIVDDPSFLDPNGDGQGRNRAALIQTFEDLASDELFTLAINHFKSKGGTGTGVDADQGDGQGNFNDARTDAANFLVDLLAQDPTGVGGGDTMILGDLNAYAREDPIVAIENGADGQAGTADDYTDLAEAFIGDDAYSFVFDGRIGTLDYALANADALDSVTGVAEWHINADEADAIDYNLDFGRSPDYFDGSSPARNSDHDPLLVGLEYLANVELFDAAIREGRFNGFTAAEAAATAGDEIVVNDAGALGAIGATAVTTANLTVTAGAPFAATFLLDNDGRFTLQGASNSNVVGTAGGDVIVAGSGANTLIGGAGADTITAGAGNDLIEGGAGADSVSGGRGIDTASFANASGGVAVALLRPGLNAGAAAGDRYILVENVIGSDFNDVISGGNVRNVLEGGSGADTLFGLGGRDILLGGEGFDTLNGGTGRDFLNGGRGRDTVTYADEASGVTIDILAQATNGGAAAGDVLALVENVAGTGFDDSIGGGNVNNRLFGFDGDDTLEGRAGNDTLDGGLGADTLSGGVGADRFVYRNVADSAAATVDRLVDFETGLDVIDVAAIDADVATAADDAFTFIGAAAFSGQAGELRVAAGAVQGDVDGDGVADLVIAVAEPVGAGDFIL